MRQGLVCKSIIGLVPKIGMPMFGSVPNIRYYLVGYRVVLPISHKVANIWQVLVLPIFGNSNIWLAKYWQQTDHALHFPYIAETFFYTCLSFF